MMLILLSHFRHFVTSSSSTLKFGSAVSNNFILTTNTAHLPNHFNVSHSKIVWILSRHCHMYFSFPRNLAYCFKFLTRNKSLTVIYYRLKELPQILFLLYWTTNQFWVIKSLPMKRSLNMILNVLWVGKKKCKKPHCWALKGWLETRQTNENLKSTLMHHQICFHLNLTIN